MRAAERAASARRIREISSGEYSAVPQSPGVMVTIVILWPAAASCTSVPPARISASSGCAWITRIFFFTRTGGRVPRPINLSDRAAGVIRLRGILHREFQVISWSESRHAAGFDLHGAAESRVAHLARLVFGCRERAEADERYAIAPDQTRLHAIQNRVQRLRGLGISETRITCDFADQITLIHRISKRARRYIKGS